MGKFFKIMIRSFSCSFSGLKILATKERNFKIHLFAVFVVVIAGIIFKITAYEWIAIALVTGLVLVAEGLNSAIEKLSDIVHPGYSEKIKVVKDIAAAAVLVAAIIALIVALIIFLLPFFSPIITI